MKPTKSLTIAVNTIDTNIKMVMLQMLNTTRFSMFDFRRHIHLKPLHSALLSGCFLLMAGFLNAQIVTGKVSGKQNNELSPIPGAIVQISGSDKTFSTDAKGQFSFSAAPYSIQLFISATGFKTDTFTFRFGSNDLPEFILESTTLLSELEVGAKNQSTLISSINPIKTEIITETELYKAACCNLSESFQNNATVDISTTNAVTGSKEIQMLGLAGIYTQLTIENLPMMRGLGVNQALNFIPGSWVESIQVSKGTGSVANGYESITGQINTELKKPDCKSEGLLNGYINNMQRMEVNAIKVFRIN
ncbi:MAG: carboxypeptidase-like regulatory domain-containing protein, partial [Bacteroidia bacterium]